MRIGYFLSCEEYTPAQLIEQAKLAQEAGFQGLWISDHYHPWNDAQGQSPFVWSIIGALSQVVTIPVTTAVTCPIQRLHPAVVAQAAATSAVLHDGRFVLGVGTGEALNEHITGERWPFADERLEMLEEAVEVMRALWAGEFVTHHGKHYRVDQARLYTLPAVPPKVYVSAFGPKALGVAGRIGDGYLSTMPDGDLVQQFRDAGGAGKPVQGGFKGCWAPTEDEGVEIAHRLWANAGVPGELSQVLPSPRHFEQASELVTPEATKKSIVCGPDAAGHAAQLKAYQEAGFDEVYIANIGPNYRELIDLYRREFL
ncbi:TIGR03557 family F420-dependent LLM class oxidoreductase [Actinoplanes oblitus]|uniref:TIGR03557 family F420-dependent LLM class oxidoreductase n=1 Tax=Actinoplanes oblitus TaxID=3040509 RepID=A0ABY8WP86_9ACTN|nr:TIGR03557 family F420-dependent LLM class oxidoreductase [Actinoplanes oblitus]WIM99458.1 TIGR03557 family F420-dependent LLM class oxidoreductase [Actinoplanes oblitus]